MAAAQDQERTDQIAGALLLAAIAHERFGADMRARLMRRFRQMERDLIALLLDLDYQVSINETLRKQQVADMMEAAADVVGEAYDEIIDGIRNDLRAVAETSEGSSINALVLVLGPVYAVSNLKTIPIEKLHELADGALFEGASAQDWLTHQEGDALFRFRRAVMDAAANNLRTADTIDVIRGTRESNRQDGIFQTIRRNAEALILTLVQAVASAVRLEVFKRNADTVKMVGQLSVLDSRTSDICMAYSSKRWRLPDYDPVGHTLPFGGGTPRHWRCRSQIIPLLGDSAVPGWSYDEWLRTRTEDEQQEILGRVRWEVWQKQRLQLADLTDQSGNPLSVAELKRLLSRRSPD